MREHLHILADGVLSLVLQTDSTAGRACRVIVERVLDGEVLYIETF